MNKRSTFASGVGNSSSSSRTSLSMRNVVVGFIVLFLCVSLFFVYHGHLQAEKVEHESIISHIKQLQMSLESHQDSEQEVHHKLDHNVKGVLNMKEQLPFLAKSIAKLKLGSKESHDGINGKVSGMETTSHDLKDKVEMLQSKIDQHEQVQTLVKPEKEDKLVVSNVGNQGLRGSSATDLHISHDEDDILSNLGLDTVLLVIASSKRHQYLKRCLDKVVEYHPLESVTIVVSQDGESPLVDQVIQTAIKQFNERHKKARVTKSPNIQNVNFMHLKYKSTQAERGSNGYYALCAHYKWALKQVFEMDQIHASGVHKNISVKRVIILEEDLEIAPDFYEYFGAMAPLLDRDEHLLTVSAWNDNGQASNVRDPQALYRSDFFPGLGWMMTKQLYEELIPKWPKAYWDDWLREPIQRKNRHSIHPEISRTLHYGKNGVSSSQFQDNYMDKMKLNDKFIHFRQLDLKYLEKGEWDQSYTARVQKATLVLPEDFDNMFPKNIRISSVNFPDNPREFRVEYFGNVGFEKIAQWAGVMDNIKANIPRTAYKGIVSLWVGQVKLHLVPKGL